MIRSMVARGLVVGTLVAGGFGVAGTAFAEPGQTGGSGGTGACPVVSTDRNGNETMTYVPHGTKLGGLTCKDGTWVYAKAAKAPATVAGVPEARPTSTSP